MNDFDPGEGWREMPHLGDRELPKDCVAYLQPEGGWRYWVREVPVLALPTEPYTVIRVTWRSDSARPALGDLGIRTLFPDGTWTGWAVENLLERITGFEVLAAPAFAHQLGTLRRETAKAVLDRVMITGISGPAVDELYREFGVEA